jgi:subtilisin family serine protease
VRAWCTCLVLSLCAAVTSSALAGGRIHYVERPGIEEFTGSMIARPVQLQDWVSSGLAQPDAQVRVESARALLATYQLVWYEELVDHYVIVVPQGKTENDVANELMDTGLFQYVEPNWRVFPQECPNDTNFGSMWAHGANRVNSCAAWDIHKGTNSTTVAVCDTGVRTSHLDLTTNRKEGYNAVDRLWESQGGNVWDLNGHGTHTTGTAAATGNNSRGVVGMGWNLGHRMCRVSNRSDGGSSLDVLQHAALTGIGAGDKAASVSYSGVSSFSNRTVATQIKSMGGLLVWAAGNDGARLNWGHRDNDDIIVVGATDSADRKASWSAYGPSMDVVAPGVSILSTWNSNDNSYATLDGTSMATPHVAGLCTLIWSYRPGLTPNQVEQFLKQGCDDLGTAGQDDTFGYGRIDSYNSLVLAGGTKCEGDLNGDGQRDQADLAILLAAYGTSNAGDIDGDGDTDQADLAILLANFGVPC